MIFYDASRRGLGKRSLIGKRMRYDAITLMEGKFTEEKRHIKFEHPLTRQSRCLSIAYGILFSEV